MAEGRPRSGRAANRAGGDGRNRRIGPRPEGRLRNCVPASGVDAAVMDEHILVAGFTKPECDTIVAAGPNGALPHASPSERRLSEGDLVVLDFGGVYDSYCVDLTRTVSVGKASP